MNLLKFLKKHSTLFENSAFKNKTTLKTQTCARLDKTFTFCHFVALHKIFSDRKGIERVQNLTPVISIDFLWDTFDPPELDSAGREKLSS